LDFPSAKGARGWPEDVRSHGELRGGQGFGHWFLPISFFPTGISFVQPPVGKIFLAVGKIFSAGKKISTATGMKISARVLFPTAKFSGELSKGNFTLNS